LRTASCAIAIRQNVAVLAVRSERVSASHFPDPRENTGNFGSFCPTLPCRARFFRFASTGNGKIP
jgi:hypothetical protein